MARRILSLRRLRGAQPALEDAGRAVRGGTADRLGVP
jgi:hypothetical protein